MTEVPAENGGGSSLVTLQVTSNFAKKRKEEPLRRYAHNVLDIQNPLRRRGLRRRTH